MCCTCVQFAVKQLLPAPCSELWMFNLNGYLWWCRMENTVLGDALEGVPEGSSEEGEKQENSKFESADNLDGEQ